MAGSEELGLREDTLKVLAAFLRRGDTARSPIPIPPRNPAQEEPTDFLSRLRRCLPCSLGQGAVPPESPRPCSLPLQPCYGSEPGPATPDFYALVAQRLEQLVQEQLRSPPSPESQGPPPTEKEALLRRLVALLEEEAEDINQKVMVGLLHPLAKIGTAGWLGTGIRSWICILIGWSGGARVGQGLHKGLSDRYARAGQYFK